MRYRVSGRVKRVHGSVCGGGQENVRAAPVWGWSKDRRYDHRAMGHGASSAPYLRSPD